MNEKELTGIMERIKQKRIELELSYQDFAKITGLSKSTLQRYETGGIKNLPIDKFGVIARALNVSPAYLMGWTDSQDEHNYDPSNYVGISKETGHFVNQIPYEHYEKIMIYLNNLSSEELIEAENYLEYLSQRRKNKGGK